MILRAYFARQAGAPEAVVASMLEPVTARIGAAAVCEAFSRVHSEIERMKGAALRKGSKT